MLNVFKVDSYLDGETVGLTSWDRGWESTDVSWQDEEGDLLTNYEKETILHESGHSVGLEHPNGDGYDQGLQLISRKCPITRRSLG